VHDGDPLFLSRLSDIGKLGWPGSSSSGRAQRMDLKPASAAALTWSGVIWPVAEKSSLILRIVIDLLLGLKKENMVWAVEC